MHPLINWYNQLFSKELEKCCDVRNLVISNSKMYFIARKCVRNWSLIPSFPFRIIRISSRKIVFQIKINNRLLIAMISSKSKWWTEMDIYKSEFEMFSPLLFYFHFVLFCFFFVASIAIVFISVFSKLLSSLGTRNGTLNRKIEIHNWRTKISLG